MTTGGQTLPRWRTDEARYLRHRNALTAAARTWRTPRACQDKAKALGLPAPRMPHACYWPAATIARARRLRGEGMSVASISRALGAPFGTVRHWIYDKPKPTANQEGDGARSPEPFAHDDRADATPAFPPLTR